MIKFACTKCGQHINVDDKFAGKKGKCPKCSGIVVVPGKSAAIAFSCANCGHRIKVPESYAGKKGRCPKCKEAVVVPVAKEEPAAEPSAASISCPMCGQAIPLAEDAAEEYVECPECGSYVETSSSEGPSPYEDVATDEDEEGVDEEASETAGLDRRLILIIAGVAAVVIIGLITLVVVLKSSKPEVPERPVGRRERRQTTEPDTRQPAAPVRPATQQPAARRPAAPAATSTVQLRFAPTPGSKRTVCITTRLDTSVPGPEQQQNLTAIESLTLDLEPATAGADGSVPIKVTLAALQVSSEVAGTKIGVYDSANPPADEDVLAATYAAFIGKHWTIRVSDRGEILDFGLDELFSAAAEYRVNAEDSQMREAAPSPEDAERVIQRRGAKEDRIQAMKEQLEAFPIFGKNKVIGLLQELIGARPDRPLRQGDRWNEPIRLLQGGQELEIAGTHTLTAIEDKTCTITSEGQRKEPITDQMGPMKVDFDLGDCRTITTMDRQTGWLLSKEHKLTLSGLVEPDDTGTANQNTPAEISLALTVTVATVATTDDNGVPEPQGSERLLPAAASTVQLRFAPAPGTKRTLRVTTVSSIIAGIDEQVIEGTKSDSFTFDLETGTPRADGAIPIDVTVAAIQTKIDAPGAPPHEYDSTKPSQDALVWQRQYAALIGKHGAIAVSARGRIVDVDFDDLYRTMAEETVAAQDERIRQKNPETAERLIQEKDRKAGSREDRLQIMKQQCENRPICGEKKLHELPSEFLITLPENAMREGDTWNGETSLSFGFFDVALDTTYTLRRLENNIGSIDIEQTVRQSQNPIVRKLKIDTYRYTVAGGAHATATLDLQTGWLQSKEEETTITGQVKITMNNPPHKTATKPIHRQMKTTVDTIE